MMSERAPTKMRGWWSVSVADVERFTPDTLQAMNDELLRAVEGGKQIVTIEGITLTWHEAAIVRAVPGMSDRECPDCGAGWAEDHRQGCPLWRKS